MRRPHLHDTTPTATRHAVARFAAVLVLGLLAGGGGACGSPEPPAHLIDLAGPARFVLRDDPGFAAVDLDDTGWERVSVPVSWRPWAAEQRHGWYRIRFQLPAGAPVDGLALDLGIIGWSDQVFLNGQLIGATGDMYQLPDPVFAPRVYPLPAAALRPGDNLLAIRVQGVGLAPSGLLSSRIGIGDALALTRWRGRTMSHAVAIEATLFGFLGFGWLLVAFFPKRGRAGRATIFLLVSVTLQLANLWLVGVIGHDSGWHPAHAPQLAMAFTAMVAWTSWSFVAVIAAGRLPRPMIAMIGVHAVLVLLAALTALVAAVLPSLLLVLVIASAVLGLAIGGLVAVLVIRAVRARAPGAIPMLVGMGAMLVAVVAMTTMRQPHLGGVLKVYYGLATLAACAMLALTRHVRETGRQARRAAAYALEAHSRERTRLSRDLHDGLGQMLALLKMQLQRAGRAPDGGAPRSSLAEEVAQLDATIDEMRRISRDLRPAPLEGRGFGEAVREYGAALSRRSDLEVVVEGDYQGPMRDGVGDELYRIVQECLTNCLKHSGAGRVEVILSEPADQYRLVVTDDGRGMPAEATTPGIGLTTMRERSELLGGTCTITAPPGGGTRVEIEVPREGPEPG